MFDLLKEKLSSFTSKLRKKAEEKTVVEKTPPRAQKSDLIFPEDETVNELKLSREALAQSPRRKEPQLATVAEQAQMQAPEPKAVPPTSIRKEEEDSSLSQYIRGVKESLKSKKTQEIKPLKERIESIQRALEEEKQKVKEPLSETRKPAVTPKPLPPRQALAPEKKPLKEKPTKTAAPAKPVERAPLKEKQFPGSTQPVPEEEDFKLKPLSELMKEVREEDKPFSLSQPEASPKQEPKAVVTQEKPPVKEPPAPEKRELKARVGALHSLKGVIRGYTELREGDIADLLFELELALLESDVNHETAKAFVSRVKELLLKEKIPRGTQLNEFLKQKIRQVLLELTETKQVNVFEMADSKKPFKILFLGPNGAGKTTTIAKLTFAFQQSGKKVVWAAADTFRAASIEQLEAHAKKLNVRVVKHDYGADPTAVAFDAVKAAEAEKADVLMIDSAGRQETNRNLLEELKKMERVIKPDLKVFVGEAFAGKNLIEQARAFDEALNLDGFILSKIDTDAKGGTVLSLLYELKKPVLFIGTGQEYTDLIKFTPEFIIDRIV